MDTHIDETKEVGTRSYQAPLTQEEQVARILRDIPNPTAKQIQAAQEMAMHVVEVANLPDVPIPSPSVRRRKIEHRIGNLMHSDIYENARRRIEDSQRLDTVPEFIGDTGDFPF